MAHGIYCISRFILFLKTAEALSPVTRRSSPGYTSAKMLRCESDYRSGAEDAEASDVAGDINKLIHRRLWRKALG